MTSAPEYPRPSQRLSELGIELPEVVPPLAAYVPATRSGDQVLTAGQLPLRAGELIAGGKVGAEVSPDEASLCAQQAVLNGLAAVVSVVGDIDAVRRVVRVVVYVASTPAFSAHPSVANGASELLGEIFGENGRHVRSAVGVASLPLDAPVEVELVVEVG
ncbi:MAG: RidA/YER057c/UK114 superfamily, group 1 [uncultured Nocardioidaceae bacterium]|uniref:RidA/YER057c/UK114 superfamily, group 1 n=1 Tax=uncultured Nocardioidaceae bacterium TaxID=253824 RepID=A0A6J4LW78_9ACTN|nr:MAG: RidA/YER057c/UK114 superfamily, group 1 [uncultured Nocardioidaceae bacterium]